jgi:hypothetical protein
MRKAIVNLVSPIQRYLIGQSRLLKSYHDFVGLRNGIEFHSFIDEATIGSPPHHENPYAFKLYAIEKLRHLGVTQILWLDASVVFVRDCQPIFDIIQNTGFFFEAAGHYVGSWSNEQTLEYFGITREEANTMPMFSAGLTGLNFENDRAVEFFNSWKHSMLNGMFKGSWADHRHDMTCGSIIANKMNLQRLYADAGTYFPYVGGGYAAPKETAIGHLIGI